MATLRELLQQRFPSASCNYLSGSSLSLSPTRVIRTRALLWPPRARAMFHGFGPTTRLIAHRGIPLCSVVVYTYTRSTGPLSPSITATLCTRALCALMYTKNSFPAARAHQSGAQASELDSERDSRPRGRHRYAHACVCV